MVAGKVFFGVYHSEAIITKGIPEAAERVAALYSNGYQEADIEGKEHYYRLENKKDAN